MLLRVVAPLTSNASLMVTFPVELEIAPWTFKVLLRVVAPVTPSVPLIVVESVIASPNVVLPVVFSVVTPETAPAFVMPPDWLLMPLKVEAPVTPSVPPTVALFVMLAELRVASPLVDKVAVPMLPLLLMLLLVRLVIARVPAFKVVNVPVPPETVPVVCIVPLPALRLEALMAPVEIEPRVANPLAPIVVAPEIAPPLMLAVPSVSVPPVIVPLALMVVAPEIAPVKEMPLFWLLMPPTVERVL